jgi:hypothetical protein
MNPTPAQPSERCSGMLGATGTDGEKVRCLLEAGHKETCQVSLYEVIHAVDDYQRAGYAAGLRAGIERAAKWLESDGTIRPAAIVAIRALLDEPQEGK